MNSIRKLAYAFFVRFFSTNNFRAGTFVVVWLVWLLFNLTVVGIGPSEPIFAKRDDSTTSYKEVRKARMETLLYGGATGETKKTMAKNTSSKQGLSWWSKVRSWSWIGNLVSTLFVFVYLVWSQREEAWAVLNRKRQPPTSNAPNTGSGESGQKERRRSGGILGGFLWDFGREIIYRKFFWRWFK